MMDALDQLLRHMCAQLSSQVQSQFNIHFRGSSLKVAVYLWTPGQKHLRQLIYKIVSLSDIHLFIHSRFTEPCVLSTMLGPGITEVNKALPLRLWIHSLIKGDNCFS